MSATDSGISGLDARELHAGYLRGDFAPSEVIASSLSRIDELDGGPSGLLAVISRIDAGEVPAFDPSLPLGGLPILVKDNIDTASLPTTAGSLALEGSKPSDDAQVVAAIRRLGGAVIGKTNLSEWANMRGTHSSSGWSALGGQCRNPHVLDRSPGGSSSGSAVAVAAGYVPLALGTETDGSVLCPAALNGVFGFKPTHGVLPTRGVIPIASSQDTVGLFARSAKDVSYAFGALVGDLRAERGMGSGFDGALDRARSRSFTIGVPRSGFFGYSPKADAVFEEALEAVRGAGIAVVDEVDAKTGSDFAMSEEDELVVLIWEMHHDLGAYLAARGVAGASSIEEIVAFNAAHPRRELELFGQEHLEAAITLEGYTEAGYRRARSENQRRAEGAIARAKTLGEVDVLCVPTMGPAWTIDHVNGDFVSGAGYSVAAVAGAPSISVPIGEVSGLPVGMTVFSHAYADTQVLAAAERIAEILAVRLTPRFLPRIDS